MIKSEKQDCLSCGALIRVADCLAADYGLTRIDASAIRKMIVTRDLPLVSACERGMMWVDREYIAYCLTDGAIHYVYMTLAHIHEEQYGYRCASRQRGIQVALPEDVAREFGRACREMSRRKRHYWVDGSFRERHGGGWLD